MVPAKARPEGYEGPVFEFELNAKSMIVTEDSAKPMKLAQWWADLPNAAGDNAGAVFASTYLGTADGGVRNAHQGSEERELLQEPRHLQLTLRSMVLSTPKCAGPTNGKSLSQFRTPSAAGDAALRPAGVLGRDCLV